MAFSFPRAPRVKAGEPPLSRDMIALAEAWNARERSGLGDFSWRCCMMWQNTFRQVRHGDGGFLFPGQGEFFELYQLLDGENGAAAWPEAGPGEPEGSNEVSPMIAYVHGIEEVGFASEQVRIGDGAINLWQANRPPATDEEWWELHKHQCGVIDPITGDQNIPSITAARSPQYINYSASRLPYGKTWGGFLPSPIVLLNDCGSAEDTGLGVASREIFFSALREDASTAGVHGTVSTVDGRPRITYAGSCPWWSESVADGHVQTILRFADYYYVAVHQGGGFVWDILPTADWLEGPYTGNGMLYRYDAGTFARATWAFSNSFGGSSSQRAIIGTKKQSQFDIDQVAFAFEKFHTENYLLAPNRAVSTVDGIEAAYPTARIVGSETVNAGKLFEFGFGGQTTHDFAPGFLCCGFFAKATNLFDSVTIEILNGTKVVHRLRLSPGTPTALKFFDSAITPAPLTARLASPARFSAAGEIRIEFSEQLEYKPNLWDAALVLRLSATGGGDEGQGRFLDGAGIDCDRAKQIFQDYQKYGCIVNTTAAGVRTQGSAVNTNPVFDAYRRLSREMMRIVEDHDFRKYAVINGKPTLWFNRYAYGQKNTKADIFHGIAPDYRTVPEVIEGVEYIVRSHTGGKIIYEGAVMSHGTRFFGRKTSTYEAQGDALLLFHDGIRSDAHSRGTSNEWLMFLETHVYHPSESSLWKRDAYARWYFSGNRCQLYNTNMPSELARVADLPSHPLFDPDYRSLHLSPEVPSGLNFTLNSNAAASADFCASCQIYREPYEIESATVEFDANGDDVVKLVFKKRFQTHPDAPSTITADAGAWSQPEIDALRAEDYRTDDNALREFMLLHAAHINASWKTGDAAWITNGSVNGIQLLPDNPYGSIIPRFFFSALIKKPHEDGNDSPTENDTLVLVDELIKLEFKIKASCEGCVDDVSTQAQVCGNAGYPFDYLFENLVFDACGKRGLYDFKDGHGPLRNTKLRAQLFNDTAACIDLMNKFRVDGLLQFQTRTRFYSGAKDITPQWGTQNAFGPNHGPPTEGACIWSGAAPPAETLDSDTGFGPGGSWTASVAVALTGVGPSGTKPGVLTSLTKVDWQLIATPGFENAIPVNLQSLVDANSFAIYGTEEENTTFPGVAETTTFSETSCFLDGDGAGAFWDGTKGYKSNPTFEDPPAECVALTNGSHTIAPVAGGSGWMYCAAVDSATASIQESYSGALKEKIFTVKSILDPQFGITYAPSAVAVVPLDGEEEEA